MIPHPVPETQPKTATDVPRSTDADHPPLPGGPPPQPCPLCGRAAAPFDVRLRAELAAAVAQARTLEQDLATERALREVRERQVRLYERLARTVAPAQDVEEHLLTKLLVLAHPDKWQGQAAEALAHELSVTINAMRAKGGQR